jgi:hypothetical protein
MIPALSAAFAVATPIAVAASSHQSLRFVLVVVVMLFLDRSNDLLLQPTPAVWLWGRSPIPGPLPSDERSQVTV